MKVRYRSLGSFRVAKIEGELSGKEAAGFRILLARELGHRNSSLALDLSEVTKSSTQAVGVILEFQKMFKAEGRRLVVLSPAPGLKELLIQTQADKIVPVVDSKEELIQKTQRIVKGVNTA